MPHLIHKWLFVSYNVIQVDIHQHLMKILSSLQGYLFFMNCILAKHQLPNSSHENNKTVFSEILCHIQVIIIHSSFDSF